MPGEQHINYFYCMRVTDPDICHNIHEALEWVVDKRPQYKDVRFTKEMLHITLCEVSLRTEDEVAHASQVLQDMESDLRANWPTSDLRFKGITDLRKNVMIAKVDYEQDFRDFAQLLISKVKSAGIRVNEAHGFNPYMPLLKAKKATLEKINPWLYVHLKETLFGKQAVKSVHLCKMDNRKRGDGFYITPSEIFL